MIGCYRNAFLAEGCTTEQLLSLTPLAAEKWLFSLVPGVEYTLARALAVFDDNNIVRHLSAISPLQEISVFYELPVKKPIVLYRFYLGSLLR